MSSQLIRSYRALSVEEGFEVDREEIMRGTKETMELEILLTRLVRTT